MKKLYFLLFLALPMFLITNQSHGQTTLAVGDIVVFQNQADTPDDFAFVTFVNIDAGTGIFFTDCGASDTGFPSSCNEGAFKYTAPAGGLSAGDIVRLSVNSADFTAYNDSIIVNNFATSTAGDQIIVFQDSTDAAGGSSAATAPTFLFIINNASTAFTGVPTDANQTGLPTGLNDTTPPRSALGLGEGSGAEEEWDNTVYSGSYDFSGFATPADAINAARLAMTDPANYMARSNSITDTDYANAVAAIPSALTLSGTLSNGTTDILTIEFSIYPNPTATGEVTISSGSASSISVVAYDMLGKQVKSEMLVSGRLNVSDLKSGIYILRITQDNATTTKKLVIR